MAGVSGGFTQIPQRYFGIARAASVFCGLTVLVIVQQFAENHSGGDQNRADVHGFYLLPVRCSCTALRPTVREEPMGNTAAPRFLPVRSRSP